MRIDSGEPEERHVAAQDAAVHIDAANRDRALLEDAV
jgi:hypothetical protein